ncbi:unnamed protein product [Arctogadus glacialis]
MQGPPSPDFCLQPGSQYRSAQDPSHAKGPRWYLHPTWVSETLAEEVWVKISVTWSKVVVGGGGGGSGANSQREKESGS